MKKYTLFGKNIVFDDAAERAYEIKVNYEFVELRISQEFQAWYKEQNTIQNVINNFVDFVHTAYCNGVQREHNKKLNNGLPILHNVPPKRDYGRYFCIMAEKGGTSHGGLTEKLSPFFHAKKQEVNAYGR